MLISPQEYLSLTDEIAFLSQKSKAYENQCKRVSELLIQQQETINTLRARLVEEEKKNKSIEEEIIKHIDRNHQSIEAAVLAATQEQMKFFETELSKIKSDANVNKIKELEKKLTQNRFNNHEMVDFYQKIQTLYMVLNNTKTAPSMPELYKWASIRKNEELNNSVVNFNPLGVSQKSFMSGSRMNNSKINANESMSGSKMRESKATNSISSKIGTSQVNSYNMAQKRNEKRLSKARNELVPSKFKLEKENTSMERRPPLSGKAKKLQKPQEVQIQSTESVTQAMNIDGLSFQNPSDKLIPNLINKQSIVHVET